MFRIHCDHIDRDVMINVSDIQRVLNAADAIEVTYRCWCGAEGLMRSDASGQSSGHLVFV